MLSLWLLESGISCTAEEGWVGKAAVWWVPVGGSSGWFHFPPHWNGWGWQNLEQNSGDGGEWGE